MKKTLEDIFALAEPAELEGMFEGVTAVKMPEGAAERIKNKVTATAAPKRKNIWVRWLAAAAAFALVLLGGYFALKYAGNTPEPVPPTDQSGPADVQYPTPRPFDPKQNEQNTTPEPDDPPPVASTPTPTPRPHDPTPSPKPPEPPVEPPVETPEPGFEPHDGDGDQNNGAPTIIPFSNLDELYDFIMLEDTSDEELNDYIAAHPESSSLTKKAAKAAASNVKCSYIPVGGEPGFEFDDFGGTYYSDRNELDLIYIAGGRRYRFIYSFDKPEHIYDGEPAIKGCGLGEYSFDLYNGDGCFVGSVNADYASIRIIVYTSDKSEVSFNVFALKALS